MTMDAMRAAEIYASVAKAAAEAPRTEQTAPTPDFSNLVTSAINEASQTIKAGEEAAAKAAIGEASLVDVVTAVSAAEVTLETAISVRNRMIEAYQEILRMPI